MFRWYGRLKTFNPCIVAQTPAYDGPPAATPRNQRGDEEDGKRSGCAKTADAGSAVARKRRQAALRGLAEAAQHAHERVVGAMAQARGEQAAGHVGKAGIAGG